MVNNIQGKRNLYFNSGGTSILQTAFKDNSSILISIENEKSEKSANYACNAAHISIVSYLYFFVLQLSSNVTSFPFSLFDSPPPTVF